MDVGPNSVNVLLPLIGDFGDGPRTQVIRSELPAPRSPTRRMDITADAQSRIRAQAARVPLGQMRSNSAVPRNGSAVVRTTCLSRTWTSR